MTALVVRNLQPLQYEPACTAQRIVMWYAGRQWTLWVLLIALPFVVLVAGCATLLHSWSVDVELPQRRAATVARSARTRRRNSSLLATLTAGGVLVIVVLHMLAN